FIALPVPIGDSTAVQVVGAQLHLDLVAGDDSDVVLPHLSRDGRENRVAAFELYPEHRARERLDDRAFNLDLLFLARHSHILRGRTRARHSRLAKDDHRSTAAFSRVRIGGPSAVIATVCSKWA